MQTVKVCVLPYDPVRKQDFGNIRLELTAALGHLTLRIEHIGSSPEIYTFADRMVRECSFLAGTRKEHSAPLCPLKYTFTDKRNEYSGLFVLDQKGYRQK